MSGDTLATARSRAARFAFYGSLVSTTVLAWLLLTQMEDRMTVDPEWELIDFESVEEVALLQGYLRIDTTHETRGHHQASSVAERTGR